MRTSAQLQLHFIASFLIPGDKHPEDKCFILYSHLSTSDLYKYLAFFFFWNKRKLTLCCLLTTHIPSLSKKTVLSLFQWYQPANLVTSHGKCWPVGTQEYGPQLIHSVMTSCSWTLSKYLRDELEEVKTHEVTHTSASFLTTSFFLSTYNN